MATRGYDYWYITRAGERFAAIYATDYRKPPPSAEGLSDKYLFDSLADAVNYASKNYASRGVVLDESL